MTADYKKRAKAGWNSGKAHKKESNRSERIYEATAISEQMQEVTKSSPSKKKKRSGIHKEAERNATLYTYALKFLKRWEKYQGSDWISSTFVSCKYSIKELTPKLESYILREDADKKLVKRIKELLNERKHEP